MTCCKQIPIPVLNVPYEKLVFLHDNLKDLFLPRYKDNISWQSFDLINKSKLSPLLKHIPEITNWIELLYSTTGVKNIKNMYLSVLAPYSQIPWHHDRQDYNFDKSIITALHTKKSFIEFCDDKKYLYKQGYSYIIKSGIDHKILNLNKTIRITLCTTPEENSYV